MTATWKINQLDYAVSSGGETNVVTNIHWDCNDADADGNQGRTYGSTGIPTDDLSEGFIAYDAITEANGIAWLKHALGADGVSAQEAAVAAQIAVLQTPVSGSGSPWAA